MSQFLTRQPYDRSPGAAPFAPEDGLRSQGVFSGTLLTAPASGVCKVILPGLDSDHYHTALCTPDAGGNVGDNVLVVFDERKVPWLVTAKLPSWVALTLPASNGTDDTSVIQARLTAGGYVRGLPGQTYKISVPLVIDNNTTLDMQGCTVQLISGSNCNMLQTPGATQGSSVTRRVSRVRVFGGLWDRQGNTGTGTQAHSLVFRGVDDLIVRDVTYQSTAGNYAIDLEQVSDFTIERIRIPNSASDGVHVEGACYRGVIRDIKGTTGDDLVAIVPVNYTAFTWGDESDITDIEIDGVFPVNVPTNAVRIISGRIGGVTPVTTQRITVRNVSGSMSSAAQSAVYIGDDNGTTNTEYGNLDAITVENVAITGLPPAASIVRIEGNSGSTTIPRITIRDLRVTGNMFAAVSQNGKVTSLLIDGVQGSTPGASMNGVYAQPDNAWPNTGRLELSNIDVTFGAVGGSLIYAGGSSAQGLGEILASNVYLKGGYWFADLITSTTIRAANVHVDNTGGGGILNVRSPAAVVIAGWSGCIVGPVTSSSINATGTVESRDENFVLSLNSTQVVKNNGNRATAQAAAGTIAAGSRVEYNSAGGHWYDLRGNSF